MFVFRFFPGVSGRNRRVNPLVALYIACALALGLSFAPAASAQDTVAFDIPAQNLSAALSEYARQSGLEMLYSPEIVAGKTSTAVDGDMTRPEALGVLLQGTGLEYEQTSSGGMMVGDEAALRAYRAEQAAVAGQNTIGQRRPGIEEIIVTGQKKEERIQDVPIAISAFTQEDLTTHQIAGGPDLITQIPNFTFTKTNFSGYSIQIRGIGTQAISVTTDPAVAVAFNNTPFIRNRFFEQEFYDMERVEVLRGPQGTLYGRNATAGVVNLITAKPSFKNESMFSIDRGNYNSQRIEGMINIPLVDDAAAIRIAAAGTRRDGYATNEITGQPIDGRDLWSSRVSLRFAPVDGPLDMTLVWEHFEENDGRIRSGKQLCKKHIPREVLGVPISTSGGFAGPQGALSQGCIQESLYSPDSFQTPNGYSLPYYHPLGAIFLPTVGGQDPYASGFQSRDLRVIESIVDPDYRATTDIGQIRIDYQLTDGLTLTSETAYGTDEIFSLQDFNRFNTSPGAWDPTNQNELIERGVLDEDGVFCDPQIGCSDRLVAVGVSEAESSQFSQELRVASDFDGPFNFSLGANFLRYDTNENYRVFINSLTLFGALGYLVDLSDQPWIPGETDNSFCMSPWGPVQPNEDFIQTFAGCQYIDPNPIGSLNDLGHNYFVSRNPYVLQSYAIFGESYWNLTDSLKLTAGLRWSVDEKKAPRIPSWVLAAQTMGYPVEETIEQKWREPTGRLVLDWKPNFGFTDETLLYASIARGYKAGGANPPSAGLIGGGDLETREVLIEGFATRPKTFDAEFVNALELGTKNTLADGAVTLNLAAFYYDYKDYQISRIVDRAAYNSNYDAEVWGGEIEADWWVRENLRLSFKGGYQNTRIADGETAIDLIDRAAGGKHFMVTDAVNPNFDPNLEPRPVSEYVADVSPDELPPDQEFFAFEEWLVVKPFPTMTQNCILPAYLYVHKGASSFRPDELNYRRVGNASGGTSGPCQLTYFLGLDPVATDVYEPNPQGSGPNNDFYSNGGFGKRYPDYPGFNPEWAPNNGEGFSKDLGGNDLPNSPHYTATVSGDYIVPLSLNWALTLHTDIHWQSKSWWRIFNDHPYNRLKDYFTMNLAAIFANEVSGWNVMAYVKNVTDETAITGAFLGSDDTGLTTNVFLTEPRLYGLRVTKRWQDGGGPSQWIGGAAALLSKEPGEPTPFSLTLGGYLLRPQSDTNRIFAPEFVSAFDPSIDPTVDQQDPNWGDGREIVLTYAPENGWRFALGARFGDSRNDGGYEQRQLDEPSLRVCTFPFCPADAYYLLGTRYDTSLSTTFEREEHLLVDFTVGRDVGLGLFGRDSVSTFGVGLRYAHFQSRTQVDMYGNTNWDGVGFPLKYTSHTRYDGEFDAKREFEGVGPVLSWESTSSLTGGGDRGTLNLDWSLSAGVLFGRQTTDIEGREVESYFFQDEGGFYIDKPLEPASIESTPFEYRRSDSVTVPTLGASLALSYRIGGANIGLGYQWERYFDAIDGGIEERKEYDRTIDGPYLKVTFGGGS